MATATASSPNTTTQDLEIIGDIIRRGIKRTLPCKLTDREFMQIAKTRVEKEALLEQMENDLAKEQKKRKDDIADLADAIAKMGRELHTLEQDRTVDCLEVFRHDEDRTGWVHTLRIDKDEHGNRTISEVERRPATASETQRHLPGVDGEPVKPKGLLDQAVAAQVGDETGVPPELEADDEDDDAPEDDGTVELTPAQKAAAEAKSARAARRKTGAKGRAK